MSLGLCFPAWLRQAAFPEAPCPSARPWEQQNICLCPCPAALPPVRSCSAPPPCHQKHSSPGCLSVTCLHQAAPPEAGRPWQRLRISCTRAVTAPAGASQALCQGGAPAAWCLPRCWPSSGSKLLLGCVMHGTECAPGAGGPHQPWGSEGRPGDALMAKPVPQPQLCSMRSCVCNRRVLGL